MHLRVETNRCGQPHCRICRDQPRRINWHDVIALITFFGVGAVLLVMLVLAVVWPR